MDEPAVPPSDQVDHDHPDQKLSKEIADQVFRRLEEASKTNANSSQDIRSRFWATYKAEADEFDKEFLKTNNDNLDIVLIFSGLFSAVSTTFIQGIVDDLSPDPNDTTQALLQVIAHSLNNSLFPESMPQLSSWDGPERDVVWTQCILYASLSASLLAAFGAVLGKQWLSYYARVGERGSLDARCKSRQQSCMGSIDGTFAASLKYFPSSFKPLSFSLASACRRSYRLVIIRSAAS
ncbi:hypothetical protein HGRIS_010144 [Hohenbuehelia grisea]|uniref:DUF6535 domain-containing protein n=1 Tax=Hohenbuehelia grisea TaxID=104357 RepID=A0ABR3J3E3_9AGAR